MLLACPAAFARGRARATLDESDHGGSQPASDDEGGREAPSMTKFAPKGAKAEARPFVAAEELGGNRRRTDGADCPVGPPVLGPTVSLSIEAALIFEGAADARDAPAPIAEGAGWSSGVADALRFHPSHAPRWRGRVTWCSRCRAWSSGGLARYSLAGECAGHLTRSGAATLAQTQCLAQLPDGRIAAPHAAHST